MTRYASALIITVLLSGCAGQRMQSLPASTTSAPLAVRLEIPSATTTASSSRRPLYVSRNTKGLGISYGAHPATFPTITTPTLAADVSASSSLCSTNSDGSRTCTIPIAAPTGTDDFQVTAWDAVPVSGSFSSANRLSGTTVLNQTIAAGQANSLSFTLDGVVNSIGLFVSPSSLPAAASGTTQTATLSVNATDRYGNIIIGSGNYTDANGNALTISIRQAVAVSGDTLRTSLSGSTVTSSAANTLTVTYSGNSSYGTTFSATPSISIAGTSGTTTLSISPWQITEFSTGITGSQLYGITRGPDGNLWFTENGSDKVGKITTSGTVTEYSSGISSSAAPYGIAMGSDNNLWFTEAGVQRIGRITTSGSVTEFSASGDQAFEITGGPDNNLWTTLTNVANLANITTGGTFSPTPGVSFVPAGITSGPDGKLWFTENSGNLIGQMTTGFALKEYSGLTAGSGPAEITSGSDGNLWFTEGIGGRIGRITISGKVTEFSSGITASNGAYGITSGPDGNLWFTEASVNKIGRITTSGVITEFSTGITGAAQPELITAGPDGNLWFTEFGGNRIGRLIY